MKTEKTGKAEFWKLLVEEGSVEATIMLYGFIGEEYELDEETGRWAMAGVTDIAFVKELNRLAETYKVIHLRINSQGGSTMHGAAIITAIQNCTAEVHTWNDGMCASMAADIWLVGHRRHMAKNALMMIHAAWDYCEGHSQDMRDCAAFLDKVNDSLITAVASTTGKTEDEIRSAYYADYKDHWLTYNEAVADGLVTETGDTYDAADPVKLDGMTYKQILKHFEDKNHPEAPGWMERIKAAFVQRVQKFGGHKSTTTLNTTNMTLEELKQNLKDGTLDKAAVKSLLDEQETPPAPVQPDPIKAVLDSLAEIKAENAAMKLQMEKIGAEPGASKSAPGAPETDTPGPKVGDDSTPDALEVLNAATLSAAKDDSPLKFTSSSKAG